MTKPNQLDNEKNMLNEISTDTTSSDLIEIEVAANHEDEQQTNRLKIDPANEITLNLDVDSQEDENIASNGTTNEVFAHEHEWNRVEEHFSHDQKGEPDDAEMKDLPSEMVVNEGGQQKRIPIIPVISDEEEKNEVIEDVARLQVVEDSKISEQSSDSGKTDQKQQKSIPIIPVISDEESEKEADESVIASDTISESMHATTNEKTHQDTTMVTEDDLLMNKISSILIYLICFLILIICGLVLYGTLTNRFFARTNQVESALVVKQVNENSGESISSVTSEEEVDQTALVPRPKL